MRRTTVNQFILETLEQNRLHLTAQQVYENLHKRLPAVNPSTVYRALERLVHAGKVSVSDMGMGAALYESISSEPHHHLVCQGCGSIITINDQAVQSFFHQVERDNQFHVVTNHLILFGYCHKCKNQQGE